MTRKSSSGPTQKIIWAVDAFHENPKSQLRVLQSFLKMSGHAATAIQPVAVLHPGSYDPHSRTFPVKWRELASAALENLMDSLLELRIPGLLPARLLQVKAPTVSASVDALCAFALEERASLVLVSSHGRAGVDRLALGSFAETLVLRSPIPVLVVNPKVRPHQKMMTLLFPTDLSPASRRGFDSLLPMARRYGMQILLFHKVLLPWQKSKASFLIPPVSAESVRERKTDAKKAAAAWVRRAESFGVRTKAHIDMGSGPVLEAVLKASRKLGGKGLIAMTSQSGQWSAALLGSLTRQVLRSAPCPVLITHANQPSLARLFLEEVRSAAWAYSAHPVMS